MITAKKPNTMKSYHSSALPMTAAVTWTGLDEDAIDAMLLPPLLLFPRLPLASSAAAAPRPGWPRPQHR
jgi:hypothetical protein